MDYGSLITKIESLQKNYKVRIIGKTKFKRKIFAVEKVVKKTLPTAIFVAGVHAREHITTDLVIKFLEENLFENFHDFNVCIVPMLNPDGVELETNGIFSVPKKYRKKLVKINKNSANFLMWKANGRGVDLNNNFDANFGSNIHSSVPASSGYPGGKPFSELETKALKKYIKKFKLFLSLSYHSKGEEIYFNFFQKNQDLKRDSLIAKQFEKSTCYIIKNVEKVSSGGFKDWCVQKLKIPALTIEVGNDNLAHPIGLEHVNEIFERHKNIAKDVLFAYNVFVDFEKEKV